jgi:hypothetical protein
VDSGTIVDSILQEKRIEARGSMSWLPVAHTSHRIRDVVEPRVKVSGSGQVFRRARSRRTVEMDEHIDYPYGGVRRSGI